MFDLLWDLHQDRRISDAEGKSQDAARKATDFQERVRRLEDQVDRLTLVNHAMWTLLRDAAGVTDQQLLDRVRELDLLDGVADGKLKVAPTECPQCHRTVHARHRKCLYCGHTIAQRSAFDGV